MRSVGRRYAFVVLFSAFVLLGLPASAAYATASPPRSQSIYGMDILGVSWQWIFPRAAGPSPAPLRLDLLDSSFRQAAEAGVRSNRLTVWWCMVEPERDQWWWGDVDAVIQMARNYGMETLIDVLFTPYWAVQGVAPTSTCFTNAQRNYAPTDTAAWEKFMQTIVRRYGVQGKNAVHAWEIWNEPDLWEFLVSSPPGQNTERIYADMLIRAARAIRSEDPYAKVILGGLSDIQGGRYLSSLLSLRGELDVRTSFDAVAMHSYEQHPRRIDAIKSPMVANGVGNVPIWHTELNNFGWTYPAADGNLGRVYNEIKTGGVQRAFWYTSCSSDFGLGIFYERNPAWEPVPFVRSPFYDTFKAQALTYRVPGLPTTVGPGAATKKRLVAFEWTGADAGDYPIAGYKLQIDNKQFLGTPYFVSPLTDMWISASKSTYIPFVVSGQTGGSSLAAAEPRAAREPQVFFWLPAEPFDYGTYYWRVAAVDVQGNIGPYSPVQTLRILMPYSQYVPLVE